MHTTLAVQVTQEDIDKGVAVDCQFCPIGRAVNRALSNRGISGLFSCYEVICMTIEDGSLTISDANHDAYKWARQFDDHAYHRNAPRPQPAEFIFFLE